MSLCHMCRASSKDRCSHCENYTRRTLTNLIWKEHARSFYLFSSSYVIRKTNPNVKVASCSGQTSGNLKVKTFAAAIQNEGDGVFFFWSVDWGRARPHGQSLDQLCSSLILSYFLCAETTLRTKCSSRVHVAMVSEGNSCAADMRQAHVESLMFQATSEEIPSRNPLMQTYYPCRKSRTRPSSCEGISPGKSSFHGIKS